MPTPNCWNINFHSVKVNPASLAGLRRRANRKFGRGTVQLRGDSFVRVCVGGGVFEYTSWGGACGLAQAATYHVDIPVVNMLIALGIIALTKLHINSRRPAERRLPHRWEAKV